MCLHEHTEKYDRYYEEGQVIEYALRCVTCGKHLGRWSYGSWMEEEEEIQAKHWGTDAMDEEILEGDEIIEFPNGEVVLSTNLEDYLIEHLQCQYKKAL